MRQAFEKEMIAYGYEPEELVLDGETGTYLDDELRAMWVGFRMGCVSVEILRLPDNLLSHRDSWQDALKRLSDIEPIEDNRSYYEHELKAMGDMYRDLDNLGSNK